MLISSMEVNIYIEFLDLETEVHSIWLIWMSNLQECQGQASVSHGRGTEALAFSVLPMPPALTRATHVGGGVFKEPRAKVLLC